MPLTVEKYFKFKSEIIFDAIYYPLTNLKMLIYWYIVMCIIGLIILINWVLDFFMYTTHRRIKDINSIGVKTQWLKMGKTEFILLK